MMLNRIKLCLFKVKEVKSAALEHKYEVKLLLCRFQPEALIAIIAVVVVQTQ